jgi:L-iditol 2-dehydrogenase
MNMNALVLAGVDDLRLETRPVPEIGDGELLLKTGAAFICGTDVRMLRNGAKAMPLVLGHEFAGTVVRAGKSVRGYPEGTRVAVAPNMGCGVCDACASGNTQDCSSMTALGVQIDGGFAEYVRIPAAAVSQGNVSPIGDASFALSALAEPLSCVYNSFERARMRVGETVLVIGAGPIGLMHAKLYKLAGAAAVIINDMNAERLSACAAEDSSFIAVDGERTTERVMELTRGRGADVVVVAASSAAAQQASFSLAAMHGRVIFFGGLPAGKEVVPLDTNVIHYKMITVTGTSRQSLRQYRACLDLIGRGLVDLRGVATGRYPLSDYPRAFADASAGVGLKTGFVFDGEM